MDDFVPITDSMQSIGDDAPIKSTAKSRDNHVQQQRRRILIAILALVAIVLLLIDVNPMRVALAVGSSFLILTIGLLILGSLARPIPATPPRGELRKVKITYRCDICGSELKMTLANDTVPDSPKHCGEEMIITTDQDDL